MVVEVAIVLIAGMVEVPMAFVGLYVIKQGKTKGG